MARAARSLLLCALCTPLLVNLVASGRSLYDAALLRPPMAPPALREREAELKKALDLARPYFNDGVRPEVLALAAALRTDPVPEEPDRPADKALLEAVAGHAQLLAHTAELLRRISDPKGPPEAPLDPPPDDASYNELLVARREALSIEDELRKYKPDPDLVSPDAVILAKWDDYRAKSPAYDPKLEPKPVNPGPTAPVPAVIPTVGDGLVLVLVPATRSAVEDQEFFRRVNELQAQHGRELVGGGVRLIDADGKAHKCPAQGPPPSAVTLIDDKDPAAAFRALRQALAEDGRVNGGRRAPPGKPLRTLIVWRSETMPEDDNDTSHVIRLPADRLGNVTLHWARSSGDKSRKLRVWFPQGNSYESPSELDLLLNDVNRFLQPPGAAFSK